MSTFSFYQRFHTKTAKSGVIYVKHSHQGSNFRISTGVSVPRGMVHKTYGTIDSAVIGAPELEAAVQKISNYAKQAKRNLVNQNIEPLEEAMKAEYAQVVIVEERRKPRVSALVKKGKFIQLDRVLVEQAEMRARHQTEEEEMCLKVEGLQKALGVFQAPDPMLLVDYCTKYVDDIEATAAYNTTRLFRSLGRTISLYNKDWRIDEVNVVTLRDFEKWLISRKKKNLTITGAITKLKTVVYYHAPALGLSADYVRQIREHSPKVQRKSNPYAVYLTQPELKALIDLPLTNEAEERVRDRFVLMSLVGVRYCDSVISPEDVERDMLSLDVDKTDDRLLIPLSATARAILAKYNDTIPRYPSNHFNKTLRTICERIPSLRDTKVKVKTYCAADTLDAAETGANNGKGKRKRTGINTGKVTVHLKYTLLSSHCARRTFVTLALLRKVNPVVIANMVGHATIKLILETYGNKEAGKEELLNLLELPEPTRQTTPALLFVPSISHPISLN